MTNKLKEQFIKEFDMYWPDYSQFEIADWWLSKLASQREEIRGKLEGISFIGNDSTGKILYLKNALSILQEMEATNGL